MGKARRTSQNELRDPGKMFKLPENEGGGGSGLNTKKTKTR